MALNNFKKKDEISIDEVNDSNQNHYPSNLAELNKKQAVISTEDVYNEQGILLVAKGLRIDNQIAHKLLQHKLTKPFEDQVNLEKCLTSTNIIKDFSSLLSQYPDLKIIQDTIDKKDYFSNRLQQIKFNPTVFQKLTVLKERYPEIYYKSLFCCWLATITAYYMNLTERQINAVFIAGLLHDIALVHIDPKIVCKKGSLDAKEWQAIQSHVLLGDIILKDITTVDDLTRRAIREHHERCDGTGYPKGLRAKYLCMEGQIIGMADSLQAIRVNQFKMSKRTMRECLPFLHMNSSIHSMPVYQAICLIIMKSELPVSVSNPYGSFRELINNLKTRIQKLQDAIFLIKLIIFVTFNFKYCRDKTKYHAALSPTFNVLVCSGLDKDELLKWLNSIKDTDENELLGELLETDLMQNELFWQVSKACKVINDYISICDQNKQDKAHLQKLCDYVRTSLDST